jgi:hypothetical protein
LAEHVEDFRRFLESKSNTVEHVALTLNRVSAAFDGCRLSCLADFNAGRVANWLAEQRKPTTDIEQDLLPKMRELRAAGNSLQAIANNSTPNGIRRDAVNRGCWPESTKSYDRRIPIRSLGADRHDFWPVGTAEHHHKRRERMPSGRHDG